MVQLRSLSQTNNAIFATNLVLRVEPLDIRTQVSSKYHYTSGQYYKSTTIVNYDSRVVPDLKIPTIKTLEL